MNWTNFIIYLAIGYLIYYGINLAMDLLLSKDPPAADEPLVYQIDMPEPVDASYIPRGEEDMPPVFLSPGQLDATGALRMDGLLDAISKGTIEHTAKLSF